MFLRLLARLLLGGVPRLVHIRRPIPVVWHDWLARHRSEENLRGISRRLSQTWLGRHVHPAATYVGDGVPSTWSVGGSDAGTALFVAAQYPTRGPPLETWWRRASAS